MSTLEPSIAADDGKSLTRALNEPTPGDGPGAVWTVIRPTVPWRIVDLRELWLHRDLLTLLIRRDVRIRYRQTVLGAAWAVLQPALMMVVFTVYFDRLAHAPGARVAYPVFVYAGLLPWSFFASAVAAAANSVISSEKLVSKIYIPRLVIPMAAVGAAVVDFWVAMVLQVALMAYYHVPPGPLIFLLPFAFAIVALAAMGVGALLSALNVSYRDFRYVVPFLLQLWLFATPTVYMEPGNSAISRGMVHRLLQLNPMTGAVACCRSTILGGPMDWPALWISLGSVFVMLVSGLAYFKRAEDRFADVL